MISARKIDSLNPKKKMKYTKKDLKKMLKENNINKTSNNKMALMMLAVENNLIDKNEWMEDVKEERPVGRPKKA